MRYLIISLCFMMNCAIFAQSSSSSINGKVLEMNESGVSSALAGANIHWLKTTIGTTTNADGAFSIERSNITNKLIVSFTGYTSDTIEVDSQKQITINLKSDVKLNEINIIHRRNTTNISMLTPLKMEQIGETELMKAACCNLSESFETSPSVDVSFTDAVTGTRQIQMLGLAGPYTQITRENMPDIRGLSSLYGLSFVPGTWIESIQLNKGAGTVVNGYESIAGQINIELRKPSSSDQFYFNLYGNENGRMEANANYTQSFNDDKWETTLLLHGKNNQLKTDRNNDGFMDEPIGKQFIGLSNWAYKNPNGIILHFGVKGTTLSNTGGEIDFNRASDIGTTNNWGMVMDINRIEGWAKIGKMYAEKPWKSVALQVSASNHDQKSYFGLKKYNASQQSIYSNFIYQSIISNSNHKFKTGASLQADKYDEMLDGVNYDFYESVPGVYFEYTYNHFEKFNIVAGMRTDYHNHYGLFATPRLHMRYALSDKSVVRVSGGRGQRTASIISENSGLLASSRTWYIEGDGSNKPYGLDAEIAWNYGANFTQQIYPFSRKLTLAIDFYRTDFENQVVIDVDKDTQSAYFYNLEGQSYSNSFQAQADYELLPKLDLRIAYRWYDVKTTYHQTLMQKPLLAKHRAFVNLAYATPNKWKFDYTINWQGEKRIPTTINNPDEYKLSDWSPSFFINNLQISKQWGNKFEIYSGVENLFDYMQPNPIVASDDPFGDYFDSSMIWGPVMGRNIYAGIRYRIP